MHDVGSRNFGGELCGYSTRFHEQFMPLLVPPLPPRDLADGEALSIVRILVVGTPDAASRGACSASSPLAAG